MIALHQKTFVVIAAGRSGGEGVKRQAFRSALGIEAADEAGGWGGLPPCSERVLEILSSSLTNVLGAAAGITAHTAVM